MNAMSLRVNINKTKLLVDAGALGSFLVATAPRFSGLTLHEWLNLGLAVVNVLKDSIQSESGVSLDEEMVDMLASQRAYQAASRLITTIDGMLDTVINKMA